MNRRATQETMEGTNIPEANSSAFESRIGFLVSTYSTDVCERAVEKAEDCYPHYHERLFDCLCFHADQAAPPVMADALIEALQNGRDYSKGTQLGGNPLRDCVLAVAMLLKDVRAVVIFEEDYFGYMKAIAYRVRSNFGNDPADWWNDFLDFLSGYTHSRGKLDNFKGKCALRYWLRVVLWNFLQRRPIPDNSVDVSDVLTSPMLERDNMATAETLAVFGDLVGQALMALTSRERLLLSMVYIDQLLKKDIAAIFQVHPGQITRWTETAMERFREAVSQQLSRTDRQDRREEIIEEIGNDPQLFSTTLVETLRKFNEKEGTEQ